MSDMGELHAPAVSRVTEILRDNLRPDVRAEDVAAEVIQAVIKEYVNFLPPLPTPKPLQF